VEERARVVIEIGLAYGSSALAIFDNVFVDLCFPRDTDLPACCPLRRSSSSTPARTRAHAAGLATRV
jgi:hypothetical protein